MEAALGWIGELVAWLVSWFPCMAICRKTHGGVKFVHGSKIVMIKPGLYWYWPITTEVETIVVVRQTLNLPPQRLTTKDDQVVSIAVVILYVVDDVIKALVDSADYDDMAEDIAGRSVADIVAQTDYDDLRLKQRDMENAMVRRCRTDLRPFGLYVEKCRITDFARTQMLSVDGPPMIVMSSEVPENTG